MMILCFCKYLIINGGVKRSILKTRYIDSIRIINESGLYSLILSSKLESAKRFKKWVTSEVLPSIRKTGEYKTSSGGKGILVPDFSNPADAARAWADNVAVTGAAMVNGTERFLYFNKVRGVLRLMDCCVPVAAAQASEVKAGK